MSDHTTARGLGWAGIGIGLAEIAAPRFLEKQMGIGDHRGLLTAMGVREILSGVAVLAPQDPTPGIWARVAGDAVDTALLAAAAKKTDRPGRLAAISAMVLTIGVMDVHCAQKLQQNPMGH